ncbi:MAG: hypothetical protein LOD89_04540, partial [Tissierellales bacterium]
TETKPVLTACFKFKPFNSSAIVAPKNDPKTIPIGPSVINPIIVPNAVPHTALLLPPNLFVLTADAIKSAKKVNKSNSPWTI